MSWYNKVVWSEGMFLRPAHFQQHNRYVENLVDTRCRAISSHGWGFSELKLDRNLLALGKIAIAEARRSAIDQVLHEQLRRAASSPLRTGRKIGDRAKSETHRFSPSLFELPAQFSAVHRSYRARSKNWSQARASSNKREALPYHGRPVRCCDLSFRPYV